jgi:hypothetical protein
MGAISSEPNDVNGVVRTRGLPIRHVPALATVCVPSLVALLGAYYVPTVIASFTV